MKVYVEFDPNFMYFLHKHFCHVTNEQGIFYFNVPDTFVIHVGYCLYLCFRGSFPGPNNYYGSEC